MSRNLSEETTLARVARQGFVGRQLERRPTPVPVASGGRSWLGFEYAWGQPWSGSAFTQPLDVGVLGGVGSWYDIKWPAMSSTYWFKSLAADTITLSSNAISIVQTDAAPAWFYVYGSALWITNYGSAASNWNRGLPPAVTLRILHTTSGNALGMDSISWENNHRGPDIDYEPSVTEMSGSVLNVGGFIKASSGSTGGLKLQIVNNFVNSSSVSAADNFRLYNTMFGAFRIGG